MKDKAPFDDEGKRLDLVARLNRIPGVRLPADCITRRPSIPFGVLAREEALEGFLESMEWVVGEISSQAVIEP
ncbi:MAG: hypothetical protein JW797_04920 [Bradymonadales bacterium]|nr:hypothetical protein [Bradymonadales bacterium]